MCCQFFCFFLPLHGSWWALFDNPTHPSKHTLNKRAVEKIRKRKNNRFQDLQSHTHTTVCVVFFKIKKSIKVTVIDFRILRENVSPEKFALVRPLRVVDSRIFLEISKKEQTLVQSIPLWIFTDKARTKVPSPQRWNNQMPLSSAREYPYLFSKMLANSQTTHKHCS